MIDNQIRRWLLRIALAVLACATLAACSSTATTSAPAGPQLYTPPDPSLVAAAAQFQAQGNKNGAAALMEIARTPQAVWDAGQAGAAAKIHAAVTAAVQQHKIPTIVVYNLPYRDSCGRLSATATLTSDQYKAWANQLAAMGRTTGSPVIWIIEPDGLADSVRNCGLNATQIAERFALLRYDMQKFSSMPGAQVYEDAGNPGEFPDPNVLVGPLRQAGVTYGYGISDNVSNFETTSTSVSWAQTILHSLGSKYRAVIDTSRNGNGPYNGPQQPNWCNPPGRAIGPAPQANPAPGISWYLWVKNDGFSDGSCNGYPPAGDPMPSSYTVSLINDQHTGK